MNKEKVIRITKEIAVKHKIDPNSVKITKCHEVSGDIRVDFRKIKYDFTYKNSESEEKTYTTTLLEQKRPPQYKDLNIRLLMPSKTIQVEAKYYNIVSGSIEFTVELNAKFIEKLQGEILNNKHFVVGIKDGTGVAFIRQEILKKENLII